RRRLALLLRQLALHLRPRLLLRTIPGAVAVHPPLVALGGGPVLHLLTARRPDPRRRRRPRPRLRRPQLRPRPRLRPRPLARRLPLAGAGHDAAGRGP